MRRPQGSRKRQKEAGQVCVRNHYLELFYDPYREKLYRVATHINEKYKNYSLKDLMKEMSENNPYLQKKSLIEINNKLQVERIIELPHSNFYIPVKEGLLISKSSNTEQVNNFAILKLN